jgi:4-aminobutyrate aminotransferase-like enzyme
MPAAYACALSKWAGDNDILVCFDEVQSGCGRSGRFFAFEHVGTVPDLITLGKGLSSSLPVSAVIGPRSLMDQPAPGDMSSTHGGNPLGAAAALANLEVIENENLVEASARTGRLAFEELEQLQQEFPRHMLSIQGRGLFISVHLTHPESGTPDTALADAIVHEAIRRGVMMFVTGRGFLKISPPLNIEPEAVLEAIDVIRDCFLELKDQPA